MKRKVISALTILCLVFSMLTAMGAKPMEAKAAASFSIRTSMPKMSDKNAKWYYSDINRFWKAGRLAPDFIKYKGIMDDGVTSGYVWGNCTWWAYSRASEVMGEPLDPRVRGNAGAWYTANKSAKCYPYGSTPKVGAIVVYRTHVAFIEKIVNGQIYVSESGWQTKTYKPQSTDDFFFHYGIPWNRYETPQGYIYVTDKKSVAEDTKPADFKVKVSVSDLILRSGPGTGYANLGKIPKGTYDISATTKDGNWGKLKESGNWICLDYTTRVKDADNCDLKSLSVSDFKISPAFDNNKTAYSLTVPSTQSSVTINAKADSEDAKVSGTGKVSLSTGKNTKKVTVTSESGKEKTYTLTITRSEEYQVKVSVTELHMRTGPASTYSSKGYIKPGIHTIVQESKDWGQLKSKGYWISLDYAKKVKDEIKYDSTRNFKVKLKGDSLNVRSGPGTGYSVEGKMKKGVTYSVTATKDGWGKLASSGHWFKLSYTTEVIDYDSTKDFKVKLKGDSLNVRSGPGTSYSVEGKMKKGVTYSVTATKDGWGKLTSSGHWFKLSYTTEVIDYDSTKDFKVKLKGDSLNVRSGPGTGYSVEGKMKKGVTYSVTATKDGWGKLTSTGHWFKLSYTTEVIDYDSTKDFKVKLKVDSLNVRSGPGTSYSIEGKMKKGVTYSVTATKDGWGKLTSSGHWFKLSYAEKVSSSSSSSSSSDGSYKVKITVTELNMRSGPGTSYASKGKIDKGVYTIVKTSNGWGKLKSNGYWIKLSYTIKAN